MHASGITKNTPKYPHATVNAINLMGNNQTRFTEENNIIHTCQSPTWDLGTKVAIYEDSRDEQNAWKIARHQH